MPNRSVQAKTAAKWRDMAKRGGSEPPEGPQGPGDDSMSLPSTLGGFYAEPHWRLGWKEHCVSDGASGFHESL